MESLAGLRTVFQKDGTVTAGNASGLNDGAAALVFARSEAAQNAGLTPRARVIGYAHAGVRPEVMGIGPIPAVENLLAKTGLKASDFGHGGDHRGQSALRAGAHRRVEGPDHHVYRWWARDCSGH